LCEQQLGRTTTPNTSPDPAQVQWPNVGYSPKKLEAAALAKLALEPGTYSDGGGLRLSVRSPKSRSWVLSYTLNHTLRSIGLGSYPEVTLAMARERAFEAQRLVKAQRDPHEAWAVARAAERTKSAKAMTFKQCAEKMHAHRTHWGHNYTAQWLKILSIYAFPMIGNLPVANIDTRLVLKVLKPIWASRSETASRLRGRIENVLDWAKARGYRNGENPAHWRNLEHVLPAPATMPAGAQHAALPFDQIAPFMAELRAQKGITVRALEFLILTVALRKEVIGARWDEIDTDAKIWIVSAERTEDGREHPVPLSARAIEILEDRRSDCAFVFGGGHWQLGAAMYRLLNRLRDGATAEGCRITFCEWATERPIFPREITDIVLAHAIGGKVEVGCGHNELLDKRRELMDAWSAACCSDP
jgi:integrase